MSPDELAAALYVEQGFLVAVCRSPMERGGIERRWDSDGALGETPLRILRPASQSDFDAQSEVSRKITGKRKGFLGGGYQWFYFVEAAD